MVLWLASRGRSFRFAFAGIAHIVRTQPNFQIHLAATVLVALMVLVLRPTVLETAVLVAMVGLVLVTEAINTAVESAVDAIDRPPSPAACHAKDAAAAAVLLSAATAVIVGLVVFGPRLAALLGF